MLFETPDHKQNILSIQVSGNFVDSKDSFYRFTDHEILHVTFVKKQDGSIFEEVRNLIFLEGIEHFFPSDEIELLYRSHYKSVRGYRAFLKKQPSFDEHELILKKYAHDLQRRDHSFDSWEDNPF